MSNFARVPGLEGQTSFNITVSESDRTVEYCETEFECYLEGNNRCGFETKV